VFALFKTQDFIKNFKTHYCYISLRTSGLLWPADLFHRNRRTFENYLYT
jgi:hypothetical protein